VSVMSWPSEFALPGSSGVRLSFIAWAIMNARKYGLIVPISRRRCRYRWRRSMPPVSGTLVLLAANGGPRPSHDGIGPAKLGGPGLRPAPAGVDFSLFGPAGLTVKAMARRPSLTRKRAER
jgi:hypothetical protein